MQSLLSRERSEHLHKQMSQLIPGGVNSGARAFKAVNCPPIVVERGEGDTLYDVDGNAYVDLCCSWGALIHGHAHPTVLAAVSKRMASGTSFGLSCPVEEQLARIIHHHMPAVEQIRFVSSGTEATMSAARLARAYTGRDTIVKFTGNYHGHADFFLVQAGSGVFGLSPTSSSAGIPAALVQHTVCLPYNDIKATQDYLRANKVAAVILEPIAGNIGVVPASEAFLHMLRDETAKQGALLIFDEVINGFRVGLGGAQALFKIAPDLTCLSKVIGGGFPVGAFGGRREIMQRLAPLGNVYQAGTLSGNPIAMEAGVQSLRMLQEPGTFQNLQLKANVITKPVEELIKKRKLNACVQQVGSMFTLFFGKRSVHNMEDAKQLDLANYARFFQYMLNQGIFLPPSQVEAWFVSTVHEQKNLEKVRDVILKYLQSL